MPGYVFMHADVTDPDGYEKFKSLASAAIADHGGRYLVRGGAMQPLEGQWRSRVVLLECPTYAAALAFYNSDAYQEARQVRLRSSTASVLAMDGHAAQHRVGAGRMILPSSAVVGHDCHRHRPRTCGPSAFQV